MTQKEILEASDSLRQWFKRGGTDPKTGKKFKGWVNCKTGGPCAVSYTHLTLPTKRIV